MNNFQEQIFQFPPQDCECNWFISIWCNVELLKANMWLIIKLKSFTLSSNVWNIRETQLLLKSKPDEIIIMSYVFTSLNKCDVSNNANIIEKGLTCLMLNISYWWNLFVKCIKTIIQIFATYELYIFIIHVNILFSVWVILVYSVKLNENENVLIFYIWFQFMFIWFQVTKCFNLTVFILVLVTFSEKKKLFQSCQ